MIPVFSGTINNTCSLCLNCLRPGTPGTSPLCSPHTSPLLPRPGRAGHNRTGSTSNSGFRGVDVIRSNINKYIQITNIYFSLLEKPLTFCQQYHTLISKLWTFWSKIWKTLGSLKFQFFFHTSGRQLYQYYEDDFLLIMRKNALIK